jgi:hypothetical protein
VNWLLLSATLSLGLGIALVAHGIFSALLSLLSRLTQFGQARSAMAKFSGFTPQRASIPKKASQADLFGLNRIPWTALVGLAALAGITAYAQTRWLPVLLIILLPLGIRGWLVNLRKRQLARQAWYFLMDLRLRLGFKGSLLLALQEIARDGLSVLAGFLRGYVGTEQEGSLAILSRMAEDTHLPYLGDLVARIQAAQSGTLRLDEALRQAMERMQAETETRQREQLQKIPSRLILLAFPSLLGPALFVLVFPLVARVIAAMQGFSWGGGF